MSEDEADRRASLSTVEEWQEAADTLARERAGRGPDKFPITLGIDHVEAMAGWMAVDAIDSMNRLVPETALTLMQQGKSPEQAMLDAMASAIATHSQVALELGLWLAQTGRVRL